MFSFSSISSYHDTLLNGQTTCVEAVRYYIERVNQFSHLNAWLSVYEDEALQRAAMLDGGLDASQPLKPLYGVVVGLKDVISYKGHPLTGSSKILANFESVYNATATQRLLDAGAIILGRQNCDEFAMGSSNENSAFGSVKNAADAERVPGGSSGGSAVAVQAGMCMISLGSDTGGSVRQPADFCGIVGLKPSYGRISRYGLIAYASSFDQIGILANSVDDAATVLAVIAGPDEFDSTAAQQPLPLIFKAPDKPTPYRVAYFPQALNHLSLDPEIGATIKAFLEKLTNAGHEVQPVDFELIDYIVPAYYVLTTAEASSNLSRYDGVKFGYSKNGKAANLTDFYKSNRSEGFGDEVKRRILLGTFVLSSGYYDAYFTKAQKVRRLLTNLTKKIFEDYDIIILPTAPTTAYKIGEKNDDPIAMYLGDIYTVYANLVGIPAVSLPLFTHSNKMPFGLQAMASQFNEVHLHSFSKIVMDLKESD